MRTTLIVLILVFGILSLYFTIKFNPTFLGVTLVLAFIARFIVFLFDKRKKKQTNYNNRTIYYNNENKHS